MDAFGLLEVKPEVRRRLLAIPGVANVMAGLGGLVRVTLAVDANPTAVKRQLVAVGLNAAAVENDLVFIHAQKGPKEAWKDQ